MGDIKGTRRSHTDILHYMMSHNLIVGPMSNSQHKVQASYLNHVGDTWPGLIGIQGTCLCMYNFSAFSSLVRAFKSVSI